MRITIDFDKCYMSGECCYNHPRLFKLGDDGFPVVLMENPQTEQEKLEAEQALEVCPAGAIAIEDDDGGGPSESP